MTSVDIIKMELHLERVIKSCVNAYQYECCAAWIFNNKFIPSFLKKDYMRRLKDHAFCTKGFYIHVPTA